MPKCHFSSKKIYFRIAIFWSQKIWKNSQRYLIGIKMSFKRPNSGFSVFELWWFPKGTPFVTFRKIFQKNRVRHVFRLILPWKSRIRWDQFDIQTLSEANFEFFFEKFQRSTLWKSPSLKNTKSSCGPPRCHFSSK